MNRRSEARGVHARRDESPPRRWILAVWLSFVIISFALLVLAFALVVSAFDSSSNILYSLNSWLIVGARVGRCAGFVQSLFLEISVSRQWTTLWLLAHAGIGVVIVGSIGVVIFGYAQNGSFVQWLDGIVGHTAVPFVAMLLIAAAIGVTSAAVTGALMLSIMRRRQFEPARPAWMRAES